MKPPRPRQTGRLHFRPAQRRQRRAQRFEKREGDARDIFEDKWTVSEKIEFILKIIAERGAVKFSELFESAASRAEVVCTFLALLELIRLKQLVCVQPEAFGEIEICRAQTAPPVADSGAGDSRSGHESGDRQPEAIATRAI